MIETAMTIAIIIVTGCMGYYLRSLSASGAFAAILVGLAVYIGIGVKGLLLLGIFFASSSLWSKYKSSAKKEIEEKLAKGAIRDWTQVVANGGSAAFFSIIYYFHHDIIWLIGFIVCLASANSDTWASEIGSLSKKEPIYIRSLKRIKKGTSGAVSLLGSSAAILGSLLIAGIGAWLFHFDLLFCLIIFLFGFIGNIIDTILGAFYQQVYVCKECGIETEKKIHCQTKTAKIKGFVFMDNDMVNFLSGFLAAVLAMVVVLLKMI